MATNSIASPRRVDPDTQRTQHQLADHRAEVERLEQLAARELRRDVVHPDPEPVLDPLQVGCGVASLAGRERVRDAVVARPQDHRILNPCRQGIRHDELEIDVHRRRAVEADQQARLPDVLAGERGQERPAVRGERGPFRVHRLPGGRIDDQHQVEVGELVQATGREGAAREQPD